MNNIIERIKIRFLTNDRKIANRLDLDKKIVDEWSSGLSTPSEEQKRKIKKCYLIDPDDERNRSNIKGFEKASNKIIIALSFLFIVFVLLKLWSPFFDMNFVYMALLTLPVDWLLFGLFLTASICFRKNVLVGLPILISISLAVLSWVDFLAIARLFTRL